MTTKDKIKEKINITNFILCDINRNMCYEWNDRFKNYPNVKVFNGYFNNCISEIEKLDTIKSIAVVSPANSYGLMDGGYDKAIIDYFGQELQTAVQNRIMDVYCGEQPIATAMAVSIPNNEKCFLVHTPTMRRPSIIEDATTIYQCTRMSIIKAMYNDADTIILPAFGGLTGGRCPYTVSYYMERAMYQLMHIPDEITWEYVYKFHPLSNV